MVYENLVRQFYGSIQVVDKENIKVTLKGKDYTLSLDDLAKVYKIPNKGAKISRKADLKKVSGFDEKKFKREITGNPKMKEFENVSFATLPTSLRIGHKFLTHFLAPKAGSFDYVSSIELCILWHLTNSKRVNLCHLMMTFMASVTKAKGLPYAMTLTPLFKHLHVILDDEMYTSVGDTEIISKSFVLKTKRMKMEKKKEAKLSEEESSSEKFASVKTPTSPDSDSVFSTTL